MATRTVDGIPILKVRKGATQKEIYAAARKAFTAADLAKYAEIEDGIPAEQILARMEEIHREESEKLQPKKKRKKA